MTDKQADQSAVDEMPSHVKYFVWLMYWSIFIGLAFGPFTRPGQGLISLWVRLVQHGEILVGFSAILGFVLFLSAYIAVIWITARYRVNWLRWVLAGLFVIGVPLTLSDMIRDISQDLIHALSSSVICMMHALAYYFVFTGDARSWFHKNRSVDSIADQFA